MPPLPHRIRRLTFRVKATSQKEALALRKELRARMEPTLLATFERSFDEIAAKDEVIHIPRLELRLKISGVEDIATGLPERIQLELRKQLSSMIPRGAALPAALRGVIDAAAGPRHPARATPSESSASDAASFALLRMLIHYLDTGSLPWPLANLDPATALLQLRSAASADPAAVLDQLPPEPGDYRGQVTVWFRWLQLVPEARWALVARAVDARFSGGQSAPLAEIVAALSGQEAASISRYARLQLAAEAVAAVRVGARSAHVASTRRDDAAPQRAAGAREREQDPEPFGQAVSHAGLMLLHPFLPRFFESTGVKEAGKAELTPAKLPRAAALLHLLATGEEEAFELELGCIKIILGLKLESPLPIAGGLLSAGDREEVVALLSAVIAHWSALKSTSVRGLRGSFLQRRGLVREDSQGFRLQVEPAPFDMLLGQLPWGIGVVKLPWMEKAIFTDWPVP
jgi:hypothetical protein